MQVQGKVRERSKQAHGKVKERSSRKGHGKARERSKQAISKINARSRQCRGKVKVTQAHPQPQLQNFEF